MRRILAKSAYTLLIFSIFLLYPALSYSQPNLESGLKEMDRPIREEMEEKLEQPPKEKPKIKEEREPIEPKGPPFFVKKIELVGCESFPPEKFSPLLKKYENGEVTFGELEFLAKEIESAYLKEGIIAACFVPPQDVNTGIITLRVVEARMGTLEVGDIRFYNKKKTASYWDIKQGEILNYYKISRSLQFMNKNPDREVRAALYAGSKPGTTNAKLSGKTYFPFHITASLDHEGAPATGRDRRGIGFRDNNLLGLDDTLLFGGIFGDHFETYYGYYALPLTTKGTRLVSGFTRFKGTPKKDYAQYDLRSFSEEMSFFLYQDVFRKDVYQGEVYCGIDAKDKTVFTYYSTLNRDRLRVFRAGANMDLRWPQTVLAIRPEISQGLNALGAVRISDISSRDAGATFGKVRLGLDYKQSLPMGVTFHARSDAQMAGEKLTPQEEFSLGGLNSVRGYPFGDFYADSGIQSTVEFLFSPVFLPDSIKLPYAKNPLKNDITGVIFFDHGYGDRRGGIEGEKSHERLASFGAGFRINVYDQLRLRLEVGVPLGCMADLPVTEFAPVRAHFSMDFEDQIDREFERIRELVRRDNLQKWSWGILDKELRREDSPLGAKLCGYYSEAEAAHKKGDFKKAKELYLKANDMARALYRQALKYVSEALRKRKELNDYAKVAMRYYREGNFDKAREMWENIKEDSKMRPLILEY